MSHTRDSYSRNGEGFPTLLFRFFVTPGGKNDEHRYTEAHACQWFAIYAVGDRYRRTSLLQSCVGHTTTSAGRHDYDIVVIVRRS